MSNMDSKYYKKCVVCGKRRLPKSKTFLAHFPLDPDRCRLWVKSVGIEDLAYLPIEKLNELKYVCGLHFARECFNEKGNRLRKSAIPTLEIPYSPLSDEVMKEFPLHMKHQKQKPQSKAVPLMECANTMIHKENILSVSKIGDKENIGDQTTFKEQDDTVMVQNYIRSKGSMHTQEKTSQMTTREKRLIKRLQNAKTTIKKLAMTSIHLDKLDSDTLKSIVSNAISNQNKKPQGKRWGLKNKMTALAIFKRSPRAYRYMLKVLPLPSEKTLLRLLKAIPMEPGINKTIMQYLNQKAAKMQPADKCCAVLFDEKSLKKEVNL